MDFAVGADTSIQSIAPFLELVGARWAGASGGPWLCGSVRCCSLCLVGGGDTSQGVTCRRRQRHQLGRWEAHVETEPRGAERTCLLGPPCLVPISMAAGMGSAHLPPWR